MEMERTGFGGSSRCARSERTEKVWVSVDLPAFKSFSECRHDGVIYIRAVVSNGLRDEEICGKGRDRAEALETARRRYLL